MSSEEEIKDYTDFKQSVEHYRKVNERILGVCVKKDKSGKMRIVSLQRWKNNEYPSDLFFFCIKPYQKLWCQAVITSIGPVNGGKIRKMKIFCMSQHPCWKIINGVEKK